MPLITSKGWRIQRCHIALGRRQVNTLQVPPKDTKLPQTSSFASCVTSPLAVSIPHRSTRRCTARSMGSFAMNV